MGVRARVHWLQQAEAVRRRGIADMAHAVGIGMADTADRQRAMDELELVDTAENSRKKRSESTWDMLFFMKEGYSV